MAEGKALEAAAGITPVFVTNWPAGGLGGIPGVPGGLPDIAGRLPQGAKVAGKFKTLAALAGGMPLSAWGASAGTMATAAGGVALAGAAGYGAGTLIYKGIEETEFADKIGAGVARVLALFGNKAAQQAIKSRKESGIEFFEDRDDAVQRSVQQAIQRQIEQLDGQVDVNVNINQDGRVTDVRGKSDNPNIPMNINTGLLMMVD